MNFKVGDSVVLKIHNDGIFKGPYRIQKDLFGNEGFFIQNINNFGQIVSRRSYFFNDFNTSGAKDHWLPYMPEIWE